MHIIGWTVAGMLLSECRSLEMESFFTGTLVPKKITQFNYRDMSTQTGTPSNVGVKRSSLKTSSKPEAKAQNKISKANSRPQVPPTLFHKRISVEIGQRAQVRNLEQSPIDVLQSLFSNTNDLPLEPSTADIQSSDANPRDTETQNETRIDVHNASTSDMSNLGRPLRTLKEGSQTYTLGHFAALRALGALFEKHSTISHMGILDPTYTFFMNKSRTAALCYKVKNKIAVVGGDPLCSTAQWPALLAEFAQFRQRHGFRIAFLGASMEFVGYATEHNWVSMRFGTERAVNPMTNKVLAEKGSRRVIKQVKQLIRDGARVDVYLPAWKEDLELQDRLVNVYETWRSHRNESGKAQVYMTVIDPFALPALMVYIYTTDSQGEINGFAALRKLANGYHIDPYCALPDAPRGISELLVYSAMAVLNHVGVSYLGLGFEPAHDMTEVCGLNSWRSKIVKTGYRKTSSKLRFSGKQAFHDKWYPDEQYDKGLYIVYPDGQPGLWHNLAMMHFANISVKKLVRLELKEWMKRMRQKKTQGKEEGRLSRTKDSMLGIECMVQTG